MPSRKPGEPSKAPAPGYSAIQTPPEHGATTRPEVRIRGHVAPSSASRVPQSIVKGSVAPEIYIQPPTIQGSVLPSSRPQPSHATQSRVPQSAVLGSFKPSESRRPDASSQTIVRDFASQKPGASSGTTNRDASMKPGNSSKGTQFLRDGTPTAQGTQLLRDDTTKPGTQFLRDGSPAGSKLTRNLAGASKYVASRAIGGTVPKPASSVQKSELKLTDEDKVYASRQSVYTSLKPDEKQEQDEWANRMIENYGNCPERYKWERRDEPPGGYQCKGGGHIVTDALLHDLLNKGKMGIYGSEKRSWEMSTWDGPYYQDPKNAKNWIKEK